MDLIDRQAAIRAVNTALFPKINTAKDAEKALRDLPSAQLDVPDTNVGDMISRQAAIDALADMHCKSDEDGYVWIIRSDAWARIDALPSVTPKRKTGKWIVVDDADDSIRISGKCSACGWEAHLYEDDVAGMDFCPNCGARMTEEDV